MGRPRGRIDDGPATHDEALNFGDDRPVIPKIFPWSCHCVSADIQCVCPVTHTTTSKGRS
jgi:hypothetical protein